MKAIHFSLALFILLFGLTACNLPQQNTATPSSEDVSTAVHQLLTTIPTSTAVALPTSQPASATPSPAPTATTAPTATDTAEPTSTPTVEPSVMPTVVPSTPTTAAQDPRTSLGQPTFSETFDSESSFLEYEDDHVSFDANSGFLNARGITADGWHGWTMSATALKDAYIEASVKTGECSNLDRYGIMFRAPDPTKGYFFGLSCDGRYSLRVWDGDNFTNLVDWTANPAILAGKDQTNRMGVMMEGNTYLFYVNDVLVGEKEDSTYTEGRFALFVAASATPGFTAHFDRVDYWTLAQ